ncbi:CinA family protein [Limibacillus halophilus]|uniref:Nicotinamide-nucleotide amidase n=1 Tax=Limibacillus halophilus TaxID=1579333 RepID=A0A839SSS6_9PROT|nr:CinA family protein [Limibacillus halophilus]MBB3065917.1 nicotinamide-nucleotide amidase [Limibacillus halophilus]
MLDSDILALAEEVIVRCTARSATLATAESCTGGLIGAALTSIAGSSAVVDRGFITYSNEAKSELLDVAADLIATKGAVSSEVAAAMCRGVLAKCPVDFAVSVTGIAGPGGATPDKPVGLVFVAAQRRGRDPVVTRNVFPGNRTAVRTASVATALNLLLQELN